MTAAVLSIGTEITRGEIVNTNAAWLSAELTEIGFEVVEQAIVDDHRERVVEALHRLARSNRVIVCTGGLGPTTDDLTAECVARALGVPLVRHEASLDAIRRRLEKAGRELSPSNAKQADVPQGAEVLANAVGTAPGFAVHLGGCIAFFLPGVPREMKKLWEDHLQPRLRPLAPNVAHQIRLRTFGLPESAVGDKLAGLEEQNPGLTIGYRATFPEIEVKVHVRAGSADEARGKALVIADEVQARLGDAVAYGEGADTFPDAVARAVRARGWRLAIAESCTGGLASSLLTQTPASDYFVGGAVVYANPTKTRLLGVDEDILRAHGAVSGEVAEAMAEGARRGCDVDVALAITGIAGPTGGTPEKPVGLVFWAVAHPNGTVVRSRVLPGDRNQIQKLAAYLALALVREVARDNDRASTSIRL